MFLPIESIHLFINPFAVSIIIFSLLFEYSQPNELLKEHKGSRKKKVIAGLREDTHKKSVFLLVVGPLRF